MFVKGRDLLVKAHLPVCINVTPSMYHTGIPVHQSPSVRTGPQNLALVFLCRAAGCVIWQLAGERHSSWYMRGAALTAPALFYLLHRFTPLMNEL